MKFDDKIINPQLEDAEDVAVWLRRLEMAGLLFHPDDSYVALELEVVTDLDEATAAHLDAVKAQAFALIRCPYTLSNAVMPDCPPQVLGLEPGLPAVPAGRVS